MNPLSSKALSMVLFIERLPLDIREMFLEKLHVQAKSNEVYREVCEYLTVGCQNIFNPAYQDNVQRQNAVH